MVANIAINYSKMHSLLLIQEPGLMDELKDFFRL